MNVVTIVAVEWLFNQKLLLGAAKQRADNGLCVRRFVKAAGGCNGGKCLCSECVRQLVFRRGWRRIILPFEEKYSK